MNRNKLCITVEEAAELASVAPAKSDSVEVNVLSTLSRLMLG